MRYLESTSGSVPLHSATFQANRAYSCSETRFAVKAPRHVSLGLTNCGN